MKFTKMHGLGNDFVIINNIDKLEYSPSQEEIITMCDRNRGIGCDQLIILEAALDADCNMHIYNPDGSKSGACGNATRCVAKLLGLESSLIQVGDRKLKATLHRNGEVSIDMGSYNKPSPLKLLEHQGYTIDIGNPHFVTFVANLDSIDLKNIGPNMECHSVFPERSNINFAEIINKKAIKLKVWERAAGETLACGSGACASSIIAHKFMGLENQITVMLPGGNLDIEIQTKSVIMRGTAQKIFTGLWIL
jgi:diaminopimelate epimerase